MQMQLNPQQSTTQIHKGMFSNRSMLYVKWMQNTDEHVSGNDKKQIQLISSDFPFLCATHYPIPATYSKIYFWFTVVVHNSFGV